MVEIEKLKKASKRGIASAAMLGALLAGSTSYSAAAGSTQNPGLASYPHHFVGEDERIDSTVIVGDDALSTDVVAAAQITGQLGNQIPEQTPAHSSEVHQSSWAVKNGVTLNTNREHVYSGQKIDSVKSTITGDNLELLDTGEVFSGGSQQEITQYIHVGKERILFGTPGDTEGEKNPFLYVNNPGKISFQQMASMDDSGYLYRLQAKFGEGARFDDDSQEDNRNQNVYGETLTLFGTDFTIGDSSFTSGNEDQLILYRSSEELSVETGQSKDLMVGQEEVSIKVVGVTSPEKAAIQIDGDMSQYEEGEQETFGDNQIRVEEIIRTGDEARGIVKLSSGSREIRLETGEPMQADGEDIEGTLVRLEGVNVNDEGNDISSEVHELSGIEIAVGASDQGSSYVRAGDKFSNEVFDDVEFHFGGIKPDGRSRGGNVGSAVFTPNGDEAVQIGFTSGTRRMARIPFAYDPTPETGFLEGGMLADEDGDKIHIKEGSLIDEDEYLAVDAGDFSNFWEVENIDRDSKGKITQGEDATIELNDLKSGESFKVDLDAQEGTDAEFGTGDEYYAGTEVVDGQEYNFVLEGDSDDFGGDDFGSASSPQFKVSYGSSADVSTGDKELDVDTGKTSIFPGVDTGYGGIISLYKPVKVSGRIELPSTDRTAPQTVQLSQGIPKVLKAGQLTYSYGHKPLNIPVVLDGSSSELSFDGSGDGTLHILYADGETQTRSLEEGTFSNNNLRDGMILGMAFEAGDNATESDNKIEVDTGEDSRSFEASEYESGGVLRLMDLKYNPRTGNPVSGSLLRGPAAVAMEPEDDAGREDALIVAPATDKSESHIQIGKPRHIGYTGVRGYSTKELESDEDTQIFGSSYGTYAIQDTEDQGQINLRVPKSQSIGGLAFTQADGYLNRSGTQKSEREPVKWNQDYVASDDDRDVDKLKNSKNLVLVGGPAANSLVSELVQANKTAPASEYSRDQGLLHIVNDAFSEGYDALIVAGHSGEDTRMAGRYLTNYRQNMETLQGREKLKINTSENKMNTS